MSFSTGRKQRDALRKGIQSAYIHDGATGSFIRKVLSLPFLRSDHIIPISLRLRKKALMEYVEREWIIIRLKATPSWSVFWRRIKTNNDTEGWHRRHLGRAQKANLLFYPLLLLHKKARQIDLQAAWLRMTSCSNTSARRTKLPISIFITCTPSVTQTLHLPDPRTASKRRATRYTANTKPFRTSQGSCRKEPEPHRLFLWYCMDEHTAKYQYTRKQLRATYFHSPSKAFIPFNKWPSPKLRTEERAQSFPITVQATVQLSSPQSGWDSGLMLLISPSTLTNTHIPFLVYCDCGREVVGDGSDTQVQALEVMACAREGELMKDIVLPAVCQVCSQRFHNEERLELHKETHVDDNTVAGCGFVGRAPDMAGHAANFSAQHAALLTHHNDRWKIRLAEGRLKKSDASLEYDEVRAMTFTIPNIKTNLTEGTTAFTSPSCRGIYNAEWKVSLEKEDRFLLQAPNCGEDHDISLKWTLESSDSDTDRPVFKVRRLAWESGKLKKLKDSLFPAMGTPLSGDLSERKLPYGSRSRISVSETRRLSQIHVAVVSRCEDITVGTDGATKKDDKDGSVSLFTKKGQGTEEEWALAGQAVKYNQQLPADLTDLFEDYIQIDDFERAYNGRHRQGEREDEYDHIIVIGDISSHTRVSDVADPVMGRGSATSISPCQDYGKLLFTRFTDNNPIPGATNEVQYGGEIHYYWINCDILTNNPDHRATNAVHHDGTTYYQYVLEGSRPFGFTIQKTGAHSSFDGGKSTRLAEEKVPAKRRKKYPNRAKRWSDARLLVAGL
ncbi:hypothetical protein Bbelb_019280 [Branchiostoma belcheri]|nr:hypothetical protein Bbelb_019280 [Branchiostoma belcheri]